MVLKNLLTLFFKFPGQFHNFRDTGTKHQNPGLSRTIRDVWHVCPLASLAVCEQSALFCLRYKTVCPRWVPTLSTNFLFSTFSCNNCLIISVNNYGKGATKEEVISKQKYSLNSATLIFDVLALSQICMSKYLQLQICSTPAILIIDTLKSDCGNL